MQAHSSSFKTPLRLALAAALAASALGAQAAGRPGYSDTETVVESAGWAAPQLARAAAASGRALVEQLRSARAFLDADSPALALSALRVAGEFDGAWLRTMPFLDVGNAIRTARNKLVAGEQDRFYDDLLPIYASLDEMDLYAPRLAAHVRERTHRAEAAAHGGRNGEAASTLTEVARDIEDTTVYMPLDFVGQQIRVARTALAASPADKAAARQAIDRALGSVFEVVRGVDTARPAR